VSSFRAVSVVAALAGLGLAACGAADSAADQLPTPSSTSESSIAPSPAEVPGTGEPYDPAARLRPELMTVTPDIAAPGDDVELNFPEQTERGVAYVLELATGETWSTTHYLTSSTNGYDGAPSSVSVDAAEGYGWEDIGIAGPGPDRLVLPADAILGPSRICTANALENFCAEILLVDGAVPQTTVPDITVPPSASTVPGTTAPPETSIAPTSTAPPPSTIVSDAIVPVPIVEVYEGVGFYPACGNTPLAFEGVTWYPVAHVGYNASQDDLALLMDELAMIVREPSPVAGARGFARVVPPGPGDDVGTLVIWADGVARWVSDSGLQDVWMVDHELIYNWDC
jgi:hypothetical protein